MDEKMCEINYESECCRLQEQVCKLTYELENSKKLMILSGLIDVQNLIGILIKNGYTVTTQRNMKPFPRESSVDYDSVIFTKNNRKEI